MILSRQNPVLQKLRPPQDQFGFFWVLPRIYYDAKILNTKLSDFSRVRSIQSKARMKGTNKLKESSACEPVPIVHLSECSFEVLINISHINASDLGTRKWFGTIWQKEVAILNKLCLLIRVSNKNGKHPSTALPINNWRNFCNR